MSNSINFTINDEPYSVDRTTPDLTADTRLVDFIRNKANLKGTKTMCREGGCGACIVSVMTKDPVTGGWSVRSVNSCLVPLFTCHGWQIYTVESLGNFKQGYHPIQQRMAQFSASQCGFCSVGWVMAMYSLMESNPNGLKAKEIEDSFDGNMCRCTGYRPILDAMKSFAVDAPNNCAGDIEESWKACCRNQEKNECQSNCSKRPYSRDICSAKLEVKFQNDQIWVKVMDLHSAFEVLDRFSMTAGSRRGGGSGKNDIRIVAGNTGTGVFKKDGPYTKFLDVNDIPTLRETRVELQAGKIILGAGNTLAFTINFFEKDCSQLAGFEYTQGMAEHIKRVANMAVRNMATLAGNLMLKHAHPNFPSDIFLLFETVGAKIYIASSPLKIDCLSLLDFLALDMTGKLIVSLEIPEKRGHIFRSFKITKRHQNAHAYVNAGFLLRIDPKNNFKVMEKPSIVYGGIGPNFYHAVDTENMLNGAELSSPKTLQKAMSTLDLAIIPDFKPPDASPEYRKNLAKNLLYKVILGILGDKISPHNISGGQNLPRSLTRGQQNFGQSIDDDDTQAGGPLFKSVPKLEAPQQLSGEAEYTDDIPVLPTELFGAFLLSTVGNATLSSIDASDALKVEGVIKFIQAKDIPGKNHTMGFAGRKEIEPIFVTDKVSHAGQALGLLIAVNRQVAYEALKLVKVNYTQVQKPIMTIDQAVAKAQNEGNFEQIFEPAIKSPQGPPAHPPIHTIQGEFNVGSQAHVNMETHVTICHPTEGGQGMNVFSATQWPDLTQNVIADALNVSCNRIHVQTRRLGGAYGAKISRASHIAVACALACHVTGKPVRVVLSFEDNMALIGKRYPHKIFYEVGFNEDGLIEMLNVKDICDTGAFQNEDISLAALVMVQNCYKAIGWKLTPGLVKTNTPPNTWTRAPGSIKGVAVMELIMEHVATHLKKDCMEIRRLNLIQEGDSIVIPNPYSVFEGPNLIPEMWAEMEATADFQKRKEAVEDFNNKNRWRKRGIAMCPMRYPQLYGARYGAMIVIYHADATVAVSHGGIEMGQGINTKVAQVVANEFGIGVEKIEVRPTDSFIGANNTLTGAARTSELVCYAALMAAKDLKRRMDEVVENFEDSKNLTTWEQRIAACHNANVDLTASHLYTAKDLPKPYNIWGLNCAEVEIDCLTGEFKITRSDLIADAGISLNPQIDIGQIEGAYCMGLGLWTKEKLTYDEDSGQLLTHNTWEYKVPFAKCIPEDFRVSLVGNRPNPIGVLGTKASGEAPICLSITIFLALRSAIAASRKDAGHDEWFSIDAPITPETVVQLCLTDASQFSY